MTNPFKPGDIVMLRTGHTPMLVLNKSGPRIVACYLNWDRLFSYISFILCNKYATKTIEIRIEDFIDSSIPRSPRASSDYQYAISREGYGIFGKPDNCNLITYSDILYEANAGTCFEKLPYISRNITEFFQTIGSEHNINFKYLNQTLKTYYGGEFKTQEEDNMNKLYQVIGKDIYGILIGKNSEGKLVLEMKDNSSKVQAFKADEVEEVKPWTFSVKWYGSNDPVHYTGSKDCVTKGEIMITDKAIFGIVVSIDTKHCNVPYLKATRISGTTPFDSEKENVGSK